MRKKLVALPVFSVAFLILLVSIFRTASVKYVFSQAPSPSPEETKLVNIDYELPEPHLTPENPLWLLQAVIDKGDASAKEYLENADVRLVAGAKMFDKGKFEEGMAVLVKAEQYLAKSHEALLTNGEDYGLLYTISLSSLKHREVLERILTQAPDDARAPVAQLMDIPKMIYKTSASELINSGLDAPSNPF